MKIHIVMALGLAALIPALAQANDLMRVYDEARNNDAQLSVAQYTRDAATAAEPKAFGGLLPQVQASYNYGRTFQDLSYPQNSALDLSESFSASTLSLQLTQTVFNWQVLQSYRQAQWQVGLAESVYQAAQQDLILRVAKAYFDTLSARDSLNSTSAEARALKQQLEQAQTRFQHGASTITDVQDAQAHFDVVNAGVVLARQTLESAERGLSDITGKTVDHINGLQDVVPLLLPEPQSPDIWVEKARESNFDLLAARFNNEIAKQKVSVAQARYYPSLNLVGKYQDGTDGGSLGEEKQRLSSIGLQVSIPLFDGFTTGAFITEANAQVNQTKSQIELTRRQIEHQTRDAYDAVIANADRVQALKQAMASTATSIDSNEAGVKVGTRTSVDVLNAEQLFYSAQRDYYKARYDYLMALMKLKASTASLVEKDLMDVDNLLSNQ